MLTAVRIAGEQQNAEARRQHEGDADGGLLHIRPVALGQAQRHRTGKRRAEGRDCTAIPCGSQPKRSAAITPSPAIWAIARSMNTMPRFKPAARAGHA